MRKIVGSILLVLLFSVALAKTSSTPSNASCVLDHGIRYCVSYDSRPFSFGHASYLPNNYANASAPNSLLAFSDRNGVRLSEWRLLWKNNSNCLMGLEKFSRQNIGLLCYGSRAARLNDVVRRIGFPASFEKNRKVYQSFSKLSVKRGSSLFQQEFDYWDKTFGNSVLTVLSKTGKSADRLWNCYAKKSCAV